jgi:Zn-dependent peptidase ImmA (M78 family)
MRLPSRVCLPFGYTVRVRLLTDTEMQAHDAEDADGFYDGDERTIYIRHSLSVRRKRYVLGHELFHALADFQHYCLDKGDMRP